MTLIEVVREIVSALDSAGAYSEIGLDGFRIKELVAKEQQTILKLYPLLVNDTTTVLSVIGQSQYQLGTETTTYYNVRTVSYGNTPVLFQTDMLGIRELLAKSDGTPEYYCYIAPYLHLAVAPSEADVTITIECSKNTNWAYPEGQTEYLDASVMLVPDEWCKVIILQIIRDHISKGIYRFTYGGPSLDNEYRIKLKDVKDEALACYRAQDNGLTNRLAWVPEFDEF